jgi:hypothetical protein
METTMKTSIVGWTDAPDRSTALVAGRRLKVEFEQGAWSAFVNGEYISAPAAFATRADAMAACEEEAAFEPRLRRRGT